MRTLSPYKLIEIYFYIGEKFFFRVEHQLINVKGITKLESHYLANSIAITDSGKKIYICYN